MLARRLTTILPEMTLSESLDTTRIHRTAGRTGGHIALMTRAPLPRRPPSHRDGHGRW
jgi:magnesium chelatase family protein